MEEFYLENDHNLMAVALFAVRGYGVPNLTTGICICLLSLRNNSYNLREAGIQGSKFKDCLCVYLRNSRCIEASAVCELQHVYW